MSGAAPNGWGWPRWPVTLLTGMLGSGKTTLLRNILSDPSMRGTAILINEIGEIGLDHHLVERIDGEAILMRSGCLCCTLRADLPQTLNGLRRRWLGNETLDLRRVIIETTGLANPGPILVQLATNPLIADDFPLSAVVVTVDAQHAVGQIAVRTEVRHQIAVADLIVVTKTDIADPAQLRDVRREIAQLNAGATVVTAIGGLIDAAFFTGRNPIRGETIRGWLGDMQRPDPLNLATRPPGLVAHDHGGIGSLSLHAGTTLGWLTVQQCLAAIIGEFGGSLLRLKGILDVAGSDRPMVVHGVHDAFYPVELLDAWPDADRRSRLVLIVDGLEARRGRLLQLAASTGIDWRIAA